MTALYASKGDVSIAVIDSALTSDLLLEYDPTTGTYTTTKVYDALTHLADQINQLQTTKSANGFGVVARYANPKKPDMPVDLPTEVVAGQLHLMLRWAEVISYTSAIIKALEGFQLDKPNDYPRSPFLDQNEALANETASIDAVRSFLGMDRMPHVPM